MQWAEPLAGPAVWGTPSRRGPSSRPSRGPRGTRSSRPTAVRSVQTASCGPAEEEEGGFQQIYLQTHSGADKRDECVLTGGDESPQRHTWALPVPHKEGGGGGVMNGRYYYAIHS